MPTLYGEGKKAFLRLQSEIIRTSDDDSIFAWVDEYRHTGSLLASSPSLFSQSGDIVRLPSSLDPYRMANRPPYSMTNRGLQIELILGIEPDDTFSAFLNCRRLGNDHNSRLRVYLKSHGKDEDFSRVDLPGTPFSRFPLDWPECVHKDIKEQYSYASFFRRTVY
jgi:hypothetical protein